MQLVLLLLLLLSTTMFRSSLGLRMRQTTVGVPRLPFVAFAAFTDWHSLGERLSSKGQYTAVSFFKFAKRDRERPVTDSAQLTSLKNKLLALDVKGTLLVAANEGYNGAFCVPSRKLGSFYDALVATDAALFSDLDLNVGQSLNVSDPEKLPFKKLIVKQKKAVLTDGFSDEMAGEMDFTDAGEELEPEAWHSELSGSTKPILIDCRNDYESHMGTFDGAIGLNTTTFAESWERLDKLLENVDKDARILTFCTGGIRCIKTNAWLKQKRGMTNIGRLKKGIIHYEQWLESLGADANSLSLFNGENFLFDRRRMFEQSTTDEQSTSSS